MSEIATDSDRQLLTRYARDHAEAAFAEIVRRHLDLVHSAAFRQVRSLQLAEEVAQSVFTDLARNAARLTPDTIVTAWLYQVTRRTAIDVVRREARRQLREQIATEMNAMNATAGDWTHVEPLLDDAMSALDETDRAAVLLRYFENKSLREVGETLGTSDDAAQKRVSRAVERLREFFTKRGVTVGASGLVVVISANAVQAAPVGLALTISTAAALAGATVVSTATATVAKTLAMTTLQKTIIGTTLAAAVGTGLYEAREASHLSEQVHALQQQAPLAEGMQQLQQEREDTAKRLALLADENRRLNQNSAELLKLRGVVTQLGLGGIDSQTLAKRLKEYEDMQDELQDLHALWHNVTNSPQFKIPYLGKNVWKELGADDPLHTLLSVAAAANRGDAARFAELISAKPDRLAARVLSPHYWDDVMGIQLINTIVETDVRGGETGVIETIIEKRYPDSIIPRNPKNAPALEELRHSDQRIHRWFLLKTGAGWKITDAD